MIRAETEDVRFESGGRMIRGQWLLPRIVPPLPLVFVPPASPGADRHGTPPDHPGFRPALGIVRALAQAGVASFCCDAPAEAADAEALLRDAWRVALGHHLVSRRRIGLLGLGEACAGLLSGLEGHMRERKPLAAVLVETPPVSRWPAGGEMKLHLVLGGGHDGTARAAASAGFHVTLDVLPDLASGLRRATDASAGHWIPHPLLGPRVAAACARLLRPTWEQSVRPPGTAIG